MDEAKDLGILTPLVEEKKETFEFHSIFEMLIANMQDMIFTLGKDLRLTGIYGNWFNRLNKKSSDFIGLKPSQALGDSNDIHEQSALKALTGQSVCYKWESRPPEGKPAHFYFTLTPVKDSNGTITGLIGIGKDITELMEERNRAQLSDRLKSTFLSSISHEIRTPLNAILGFSQLMIESPNLDENIKDYANIILKRGNDLVNIVDDIMETSMIQSGVITPEYDEVPLNQLLDSIFHEYHEIISYNSINVNLKFERRILGKKFMIHSDGHLIKQIFKKLIDNALKFTTHGEVSFGYRINQQDEIVFYVSDTGIGIEREKLDYIFDLFRTGDESNTRKHDGLGLGLPIVKGLVQLLGGEIWFTSKFGEGSNFYFSIPNGIFHPENEQFSHNIANRDCFPGKNLLIVDDDPITRLYLKEVLKSAQVNILMAENGKEALKILSHNKDFDLVFLDLNLPFISGEAVLKQLRKENAHIRVIIQSAFKSDLLTIPSDNYTSFLAKPLTKDDVFGVLHKYL
jgi:signal transduction histidine kinase/CheY-like chemotaxis protein